MSVVHGAPFESSLTTFGRRAILTRPNIMENARDNPANFPSDRIEYLYAARDTNKRLSLSVCILDRRGSIIRTKPCFNWFFFFPFFRSLADSVRTLLKFMRNSRACASSERKEFLALHPELGTAKAIRVRSQVRSQNRKNDHFGDVVKIFFSFRKKSCLQFFSEWNLPKITMMLQSS